MMTAAALVLGVLLAVLAWLVARRDRSHLVLAILFTWYAVGDLVQAGVYASLEGLPRPYEGWAEVRLHIAHVFLFSREFLFAAAVLHYYRAGQGVRILLQGGALACLVLLDYPRFSGNTLRGYYAGVVVASQVIIWALGISRVLTKKIEPTMARLSLLIWALMTFCLALDSFRFMNEWHLALSAYVVCALAEIVIHARHLWNLRWASRLSSPR